MNKFILPVLLLLAASCKEKFVSPAPPVTTGYLVVEGVVNNDGGLTTLKLSRTTNLDDTSSKPEGGALVKLEDNNSTSLQLFETTNGNYIVDNLHLDTSHKYRLAIVTANNEEYLSDFVNVLNNPPIDSINWVRGSDGVTIFINTHDPKNNTHYYQWDYHETWEFHSALFSSLKYTQNSSSGNMGIAYRDSSDPEIYTCWQFHPSTTIVLGSSARLSQDIIHLPIINIEPASWKLSVLYSVIMRQYTWNKEGYEFLERMKKNTESVGSVFDAQPSELNGNIHCVSNPYQPVIGFFNICTIREERIFIKNSELPQWGYNMNCSQVVIENQPDSIRIKSVGTLPTVPLLYGPFGDILTFNASAEGCVDCTLRGSNIKPTYWP